MDVDQDTIRRRLGVIRSRIEVAARASGRDPASVTLVAVSKTHAIEAVKHAIAAGQLVFGENRVQEAALKFTPLRGSDPLPRLHLIGPLQTNKARDAVRICDVIESLDRPRLSRAIMDAAQKEGRCPGLLVQINLGDEPQKAGVSLLEADGFIAAGMAEFGASLLGLMGIPPAGADPRPYFAWLSSCARRHGLGVISMGMSADFEIAIAEGATHVRVGSAIFGDRPPAAGTGAAGAAQP